MQSFEDLQLSSLRLFCHAAETESFTRAANTLGISPAAVSRTIARIEGRLGIPLFYRTTRTVRLTEAGQVYFEHCRQALAQLQEGERTVTSFKEIPAGLLRINVATTYGQHRVLPLLPTFRARYPQIEIEIQLSNQNIDFDHGNYDVAIRMNAPKDSGLVARPLETSPLVVVASPEYLRREGTPRRLTDLHTHECIQFLRPESGRKAPWVFKEKGKERKIQVSGGITCADDVLGCLTLARAGAGLFQIMRFIVEQDLKNGSLIELLQPFACRSRQVTILYPKGSTKTSRVKAFVDYMSEITQLFSATSRK